MRDFGHACVCAVAVCMVLVGFATFADQAIATCSGAGAGGCDARTPLAGCGLGICSGTFCHDDCFVDASGLICHCESGPGLP